MNENRIEVKADITITITTDRGAHWDAAGNLVGRNSPETLARHRRAWRAERDRVLATGDY